nr:MAG TPA: hypothetical protein [Caudoviricetes sp.]
MIAVPTPPITGINPKAALLKVYGCFSFNVSVKLFL